MEVKKMYADIPTDDDYRFKLIDIGTGSGCIAIALKKYFADWDVWALDKSDKALAIARTNVTADQPTQGSPTPRANLSHMT